MAFVIGCRPVLILAAQRNREQTATHRRFSLSDAMVTSVFFPVKTVISDGQLHCGRHANGNRKLSPLTCCFGTEYWGEIVPPGSYGRHRWVVGRGQFCYINFYNRTVLFLLLRWLGHSSLWRAVATALVISICALLTVYTYLDICRAALNLYHSTVCSFQRRNCRPCWPAMQGWAMDI